MVDCCVGNNTTVGPKSVAPNKEGRNWVLVSTKSGPDNDVSRGLAWTGPKSVYPGNK